MEACEQHLRHFGVEYEFQVISAHRDPEGLRQFVREAEREGVEVFIAAAGMAAHLPGVIAAQTTKPVIGVPLVASKLGGMDALLSVVQMPGGIPVATVSIGEAGAINAAILAVEILALEDKKLRRKLQSFREKGSKLSS